MLASRLSTLGGFFGILAAGCFAPNQGEELAGTEGDGTTGGSAENTGDSSEGDGSANPSSTSGAATATGSSSGDDGEDTQTSSDDSGEVDTSGTGAEDTVAPTVLGSDPANGDAGVSATAEIVIEFSEAMDREATESAWQSGSLGGVSFAWEGDDTRLIVSPNNELAYATGNNSDSLVANEYSFTIGATAADAAGNAIESAFTSSFRTLRRIEVQGQPVDAETGMVPESCSSLNTTDVWVGDTQFDLWQRGAISVLLPEISASGEVETATLFAEQTYCGGSPYGGGGLGEVHIWEATEYEGGFDVCDAAASTDLGVFSSDATYEVKSSDVTSVVTDDVNAGRSRSQFFLQFTTQTNGDEVLDRCTFEKESVSLELTYLVE